MGILSLEIPVIVIMCILYSFASYGIHEYKQYYHYPPWCHESSIATILGISIGTILKLFFNQTILFDNEIFFYFVLPPIIFSAGYTLKRRNFFRYFHLISLFGILGTILQFIFIAYLSSLFAYYFINSMVLEDIPFTWKDGLLLSAILSGSDEVSAMSLIKMKEFPRMGALIFGEGVLNDALSIVLFQVLSDWIEKTSTHESTTSMGFSSSFIVSLLNTVLLEIFLSCLIGLACGLLHARLLIVFPTLRSHPVHQTSLILLFGYLSYALAELSGHASSILTLFVAAVTLAHYSYHSLSKTAQLTTQIAFKSFAEISEAFSFSYLGLSLFSLTFTHYRIFYSISLLLSLICVRLLTILFLFAILRTKIPIREQIGFALGGMVRGSLCWAQVQYIQKTAHPVLLTTILVVVMSTTIGSGIILPILMPWLTAGLSNNRISDGTGGSGRTCVPDNTMENLSFTQWTNDISRNQLTDFPSQIHDVNNRDDDQESTYTTHLNHSGEDNHSTPSSPPPHINSSHSFLHTFNHNSSQLSAFGRYLYILWIRFDENIMKPLFGGSVADSSRLYLLRSTRTLTAYSLLSEQSKREEVDDILMRSVELSDIIEHERENIPDNDDEDNVFIMSGISQERTLNRTAAHMPERFFHESVSTPVSLSPITPSGTPSQCAFVTPSEHSPRRNLPFTLPTSSSPRYSISPISAHPISELTSSPSPFVSERTEQTNLLSGKKVHRKRSALESITGIRRPGQTQTSPSSKSTSQSPFPSYHSQDDTGDVV